MKTNFKSLLLSIVFLLGTLSASCVQFDITKLGLTEDTTLAKTFNVNERTFNIAMAFTELKSELTKLMAGLNTAKNDRNLHSIIEELDYIRTLKIKLLGREQMWQTINTNYNKENNKVFLNGIKALKVVHNAYENYQKELTLIKIKEDRCLIVKTICNLPKSLFLTAPKFLIKKLFFSKAGIITIACALTLVTGDYALGLHKIVINSSENNIYNFGTISNTLLDIYTNNYDAYTIKQIPHLTHQLWKLLEEKAQNIIYDAHEMICGIGGE